MRVRGDYMAGSSGADESGGNRGADRRLSQFPALARRSMKAKLEV